MLLALFVVICSLFGRELYAYRVKIRNTGEDYPVDPFSDEGIYPTLNFNSMFSSLITVFALLVNEDWNYILYTYV